MIALYAIGVVSGVMMLVGWIIARGFGDDSRPASFDPEQRFGSGGRAVVAGTLGFGLGGMSASFAGWNAAVALVVAIAAGTLLALAGRRMGPQVQTHGE